MRILNVVMFMSLLSSITICPASKKKLQITKRSKITVQEERGLHRQRQEKAKTICSPETIKVTTKLGAVVIKGFATIIATILKAIIEKN